MRSDSSEVASGGCTYVTTICTGGSVVDSLEGRSDYSIDVAEPIRWEPLASCDVVSSVAAGIGAGASMSVDVC